MIKSVTDSAISSPWHTHINLQVIGVCVFKFKWCMFIPDETIRPKIVWFDYTSPSPKGKASEILWLSHRIDYEINLQVLGVYVFKFKWCMFIPDETIRPTIVWFDYTQGGNVLKRSGRTNTSCTYEKHVLHHGFSPMRWALLAMGARQVGLVAWNAFWSLSKSLSVLWSLAAGIVINHRLLYPLIRA